MGRDLDRVGSGNQSDPAASPRSDDSGTPSAPAGPWSSVPPGAETSRPQAGSAAAALHAEHLFETSAAAYLHCSMGGVFPDVRGEAYNVYVYKVLEDAGNPSDQIERMLIEQVCLAHHNIGRIHIKAAMAEGLEEDRIYIGAAALITGEFRRTVATLKNYREPAKAPAGNAEPAKAVLAAGATPIETLAGELASNPEPGAAAHDDATIPFAAQPEAGPGGPAERPEAEGPHPRRARKAAGGGQA